MQAGIMEKETSSDYSLLQDFNGVKVNDCMYLAKID